MWCCKQYSWGCLSESLPRESWRVSGGFFEYITKCLRELLCKSRVQKSQVQQHTDPVWAELWVRVSLSEWWTLHNVWMMMVLDVVYISIFWKYIVQGQVLERREVGRVRAAFSPSTEPTNSYHMLPPHTFCYFASFPWIVAFQPWRILFVVGNPFSPSETAAQAMDGVSVTLSSKSKPSATLREWPRTPWLLGGTDTPCSPKETICVRQAAAWSPRAVTSPSHQLGPPRPLESGAAFLSVLAGWRGACGAAMLRRAGWEARTRQCCRPAPHEVPSGGLLGSLGLMISP